MTLTVAGIAGVTVFNVFSRQERDRRDLEQIALESAEKHAARFATVLESGCGAARALTGVLPMALRLSPEGGFATHEHLAETMLAVTRDYGSTFAGVYFTALPGVVPPPGDRADYSAPASFKGGMELKTGVLQLARLNYQTGQVAKMLEKRRRALTGVEKGWSAAAGVSAGPA